MYTDLFMFGAVSLMMLLFIGAFSLGLWDAFVDPTYNFWTFAILLIGYTAVCFFIGTTIADMWHWIVQHHPAILLFGIAT